MAAVSNRGGELDGLPLPKEFGPRLSGRPFGSLTESDMEVFDNFAKALGRHRFRVAVSACFSAP